MAEQAALEWGVLDTAELRACGLDRKRVLNREARGWLHRKHRGVYAIGHPAVTAHGEWLAAVKACGPSAVLSGHAGGAATGLQPWSGGPIDVTIVGTAPRAHPGIRVHRTLSLEACDVVRRDRIPMLAPPRLVLDLSRTMTPPALRESIRTGEALGRVTIADLARVLVRLPGRRGARKLATIVARGAIPTRSVLEDVVLTMLLTQFRAPDVNVPLWLEGRKVVPDFRWPERRLIVEADGAKWHDGALARAGDRERQALLEAHGERVVRVTWDQAVLQPAATNARVRAAGAPIGIDCRVVPRERP